MLNVLINGCKAIIKENSSFEFVSENPLFSDADEYSLNISFPLKDCPQNLKIFGFINRPGARFKSFVFDMRIYSGSFSAKGSGIITGFSDVECTVQFLGRRSAQNYYSDLDQIFINTLDLGEVPVSIRDARNVSVRDAWAGHWGGWNFVAIPWVNEGTGHIINDVQPPEGVDEDSFIPSFDNPGSNLIWKAPEEAENVQNYNMQLSWFPYLIYIAKKICDAIHFDYNFLSWENSKWNELLLCHSVPGTWDYLWSTLLPHWSVIDFFRNLEPVIEGFFDIDLYSNKITFKPYSEVSASSSIFSIEKLIDQFSSDTFDDNESCNLIYQKYIGYNLQSDSKTEAVQSCEWFVREYLKDINTVNFDSAQKLSEKAIAQNWNYYRNLGKYYPRKNILAFRLEAENRLVTDRVTLVTNYLYLDGKKWWKHGKRPARIPVMLNNFGPRCVPEDSRKIDDVDTLLDVVPAVVDDTDGRRMLFINLSDYSDKYDEPLFEDEENQIGYDVYDSVSMRILANGNDDKSNAYFNNLAVGFYPGSTECYRGAFEILPIFDIVEFNTDWEYWKPKHQEYTLSLQDSDGKFAGLPKVNTNVKFDFSFISDIMPDVTSVFHIRGHRYLCEKLTASFTANGMSQKIKGTFWRIV